MTTPKLVLLQGAQAGDGGMVSMLIMMALLFAIVYFFMIRPQNKKQKEIQKFRDALKAGDDVVTIGGIQGTIKRIDNDTNTIILNVATGVDIRFDKSAIIPKGTSNNR